MDPAEGIKAALDPHFVTLFNAIHVTQQSDDSLHHILIQFPQIMFVTSEMIFNKFIRVSQML